MPGVNFYANDTKMTAISSTSGSESTTGTAYGAVGNSGIYSGIAPGTVQRQRKDLSRRNRQGRARLDYFGHARGREILLATT